MYLRDANNSARCMPHITLQKKSIQSNENLVGAPAFFIMTAHIISLWCTLTNKHILIWLLNIHFFLSSSLSSCSLSHFHYYITYMYFLNFILFFQKGSVGWTNTRSKQASTHTVREIVKQPEYHIIYLLHVFTLMSRFIRLQLKPLITITLHFHFTFSYHMCDTYLCVPTAKRPNFFLVDCCGRCLGYLV